VGEAVPGLITTLTFGTVHQLGEFAATIFVGTLAMVTISSSFYPDAAGILR
jgi:ABC-type molybdate transport system permease subunit